MEKAFAGGEIKAISTYNRCWTHFDYELGVVQGTTMFAAVARNAPERVTLIPMNAVDHIEVEYEHNQGTSEGEDATGTGDPVA